MFHRLWFPLTLVVLNSASGLLTAQSPIVSPTFDVASIKPNKGDSGTGGFRTTAESWQMLNGSISGLILSAYPTASDELVGGPQWVESDRYDVVARAAHVPTPDEMRSMLRSLLAERFNFVGHYEMPERPIYALVLANKEGRLGPQLRRIGIDCATFLASPAPLETRPVASNGVPACYMEIEGTVAATVTSGGMTMKSLAKSISGYAAGRFVMDKTGLDGYYEVTLRFTPQGAPSPSDDAPSIFTALQEQLGLKLEPQRAPVQVLVVDHIDRPSPD